MTAGQFREVDPDLLADYVGGALEGTPEQATVDRLITEEPAWRRAHTDLVRAAEAVRADLAGWGARPEPMPGDVFDRLTATLTTATLASQDLDSAANGSATDSPATSGRGAVRRVEGDGGGRSGRPVGVPDRSRPDGSRDRATARARRRWSRLAGPVAVAAAVVTFAGFGVNRLVAPESGNDSAATSLGQSESGQPAGPESGSGDGPASALADPITDRLLATGTVYAPDNLANLADRLSRQTYDDGVATRGAPGTDQDDTDGETGASAATGPPAGATPPALRRLTDRAALAGCLDAVAAEHASGPLTVGPVDYATFGANPALIIVFIDGAGERWAWAAGSGCGLPGSGADTRASIRVG